MKVYRWQHTDYDPNFDSTHRLLLDTLNEHIDRYPCPDVTEIFENDTRSCFKTEELAEEFLIDMTDLWYDSEIENDEDMYEESQAPEFYELLEYSVKKADIVFIDDFQIIHKTT